MDYAEIYNEVNPKTVVVINNNYVGTGFFIDTKGHIATAAHVVSGKDEVQIMAAETTPNTIPAKVIKRDESLDLALVKLEGNYKTGSVELGKSSSVKIGDQIVIIGFPFGNMLWGTFFPAVHRGIISTIVKNVNQSTRETTNRFQLDVMANPGNSGGPLVLTKNGKVVGILSKVFLSKPVGNELMVGGKTITSATGIALAIPIEYFIEMTKDILK